MVKKISAFFVVLGMNFFLCGFIYAQANVELRLQNLENRVAQLEALQKAIVLPCSDLSAALRATVGSKCKTSKGAVYERVNRDNFTEAWKGPEGMIWNGDNSTAAYKHQDAIDFCNKKGGVLPSKEDLQKGEANGFREVLRMNYGFYWSSTLVENDANKAHNMQASDGLMTFPSPRHYPYRARCMAK
ncbi:MAG: hypothetical protein HYW85_03945 [Deltaproteobacteria bacterium]|nr:hypothetical protein [Deltaproteobacteria bacterium]MBI3017185.1 hypothetical protein [Deltaproteobacteria bacterium]